MLSILKRMVAKFHHEEDGGIAVESVLVFPMLTWAYLATFVYFDAFRSQSTALKAAYTISDALSRETDYITNQYVTSVWRLHRFLTITSQRTKLRISVITFDADDDRYYVIWSRNKGAMGNLNDGNISNIEDQLPVMPDGEIVIVVQTEVVYEPIFSIGLEAFVFENLIVTRPRFASQLCYSQHGTDAGRICEREA